MAIDEDLVIERQIELGVGAAELWDLVATADGWQQWLVDHSDVDLRPGGAGRVDDGEVVREVRVAQLEHGRSLSFTWWERDEPASASEVRITIVEHDDGTAGLSIMERIPAARLLASAATSTMDRADAMRFAWEVRACVAWAATRSVVHV